MKLSEFVGSLLGAVERQPAGRKVAGRVADGFVSHAFQTAEYLRAVTMPSIEAGLAERGRSRGDFQISMPVFVVSGMTEEAVADIDASVRKQIAFYGSTLAYRRFSTTMGGATRRTS